MYTHAPLLAIDGPILSRLLVVAVDPAASLKSLKEVAVDVNVRETKDHKRTALMQVAARAGPDCAHQLMALVAAGANVSLKDAEGKTVEEIAGAALWEEVLR